jgi:NADPH2:quinone reductase
VSSSSITTILVGYYAKNQQAMLEIRDLAERGVLKPRVADVLELADGADAQRRTEAGGLRGRIVLHLPD